MSGTRIFGELDGVSVPAVTFGDGAGSQATIIGFGASLQDLVVPGRSESQHAVLGLATLDAYRRHGKSFGAVVGRYGNRIARARFQLDDVEHRLDANEGPNTLHGGSRGFGVSLWTLSDHGPDFCRFEFASPDGDMGFPGAVKASATYRFVGEGRLRIRLQAEADAATPVNLTCHAYFNLDGTPDMRAHHRLGVAAAHYLPASRAGIPTGAILPVDGTRFDFRAPRSPRDPSGGEATIDATLVLDREGDCGPSLREVASLSSERSGVALRLLTTEPGLQVYDGSQVNLDGTGIGGQPLGPFCGLALEAQRYPDGPNRPYFPPCILRPGEVFCQETEFAFAPPR